MVRSSQKPLEDSGFTTPWRQTPWGRILIGLLLAQGMYYALHQFLLAGAGISGVEANDFWGAISGMVIAQGLQLITLFFAGMLVGAGKTQGLVYGVVVGVWNGVLCILLYPRPEEAVTNVGIYGQPLLQAFFGGIGGWFGGYVWQPIRHLSVEDDPPLKRRAEKPRDRFQGPFAWGRILLGSAVAVAGTMWADSILDFVLTAGRGKIGVRSTAHASLVTWEITVMSILLGGVIAGSTCKSGLKQGLAVGILTGAALAGIHLGQSSFTLTDGIFILSGPLLLGFVGGGFGGQMLPPVVKRKRRSAFDLA